MNEPPCRKSEERGWIPSFGITLLAVYLATPTLLDAWRHDLYSRGGAVACVVWMIGLAAGYLMLRPRIRRGVAWPLLAVICCAAGSMADLRVLHHLGLGCALTGLAGLGLTGAIAAATAMAWMPAAGWLISRLHAGGLVGWERPAAAAIGMVVLLFFVRSSNPSPA